MTKLYKILEAPSTILLMEQVNKHLDDGYDLVGGLAVSSRKVLPAQIDTMVFHQAVVADVGYIPPLDTPPGPPKEDEVIHES